MSYRVSTWAFLIASTILVGGASPPLRAEEAPPSDPKKCETAAPDPGKKAETPAPAPGKTCEIPATEPGKKDETKPPDPDATIKAVVEQTLKKLGATEEKCACSKVPSGKEDAAVEEILKTLVNPAIVAICDRIAEPKAICLMRTLTLVLGKLGPEITSSPDFVDLKKGDPKYVARYDLLVKQYEAYRTSLRPTPRVKVIKIHWAFVGDLRYAKNAKTVKTGAGQPSFRRPERVCDATDGLTLVCSQNGEALTRCSINAPQDVGKAWPERTSFGFENYEAACGSDPAPNASPGDKGMVVGWSCHPGGWIKTATIGPKQALILSCEGER